MWTNLLLNHGRQLVHIPGLAVNRAAAGYRGTGKTDAKDATVIADQARMRRSLTSLRPDDEPAVELGVLTGSRADINADRTRRINRLRGRLRGILPALERALDLGNTGPLILLTGYQTPSAPRRTGRKRLGTWLRNRKVRGAEALTKEVTALNERLAATAGDINAYGFADRLASMAGVAPTPRDSGSVNGNPHRSRRYHRGLRRVFCTSALISILTCDERSLGPYPRRTVLPSRSLGHSGGLTGHRLRRPPAECAAHPPVADAVRGHWNGGLDPASAQVEAVGPGVVGSVGPYLGRPLARSDETEPGHPDRSQDGLEPR